MVRCHGRGTPLPSGARVVNRYATSGPVVVMPARVAALLERALRLNDLRIDVRGRDREVDEVLQAWHAVALQFIDDTREQRRFRVPGTVGDVPRNSSDNWDANEVAARLHLTPRGVRIAATKGQLHGVKDDAGRWWFEPEEVAEWATRRQRRTAA